MTDYLFVLTRDLATHPSAHYVVRTALGQCRRGQRVVVYLQHSAVDPERGDCGEVLESLCRAGARLLCDPAALAVLGERSGLSVEPTDEPELAALLRSPGIQAVWC